jgi:hypothetical protein
MGPSGSAGRILMKWLTLLLFFPVAAFGTITATDRGTGSSFTSTSSIVVTGSTGVTGNLAAGSTALLCIAMDNASAPTTNFTATSYTDTVGNVWRLRVEQVAGSINGNVEAAIFESTLVSPFTTSDTLTINLIAAATAKTWTLTEAIPSAGNRVTFIVGGKNAGSGTLGLSITSAALESGDLIMAVSGAEAADTWTGTPLGDGDTTRGSWSTAQHTGVGSGTGGMSIISQWKVVNDVGTQSYDPTLSPAADCSTAYANFTETDPKVRAIQAFGTSSASDTWPINYPMAAGSIGVMCIALDNAGTNGNTTTLPSTISDSKSNTWTQRQQGFNDPGSAAAGVESAIYTSVLTTSLVVGDTFTITYVGINVSAKAIVVWEFAPTGAGSMSYVTGGSPAAVSGTSIAVTTTPTTIASGDYIIGMVGAEGSGSVPFTFTEDTDTTNGTWKKAGIVSGGTGGGAMHTITQYKKVTATATQSYDVTVSQTVDMKGLWVQANDSSVVTTTNTSAFLQFFP